MQGYSDEWAVGVGTGDGSRQDERICTDMRWDFYDSLLLLIWDASIKVSKQTQRTREEWLESVYS